MDPTFDEDWPQVGYQDPMCEVSEVQLSFLSTALLAVFSCIFLCQQSSNVLMIRLDHEYTSPHPSLEQCPCYALVHPCASSSPVSPHHSPAAHHSNAFGKSSRDLLDLRNAGMPGTATVHQRIVILWIQASSIGPVICSSLGTARMMLS